MATGIIKRFDPEKNYGFLFPLGAKADTPLIFFHGSQLIGMKAPPIGAEVRFVKVRAERISVEETAIQAANIELLELGGRRTLREAEIERKREERRHRGNLIEMGRASLFAM